MEKKDARPYVMIIEQDRVFFETLWRKMDYLLPGCRAVISINFNKMIGYLRDLRPFGFYRTVVLGTLETDTELMIRRKVNRLNCASPEGVRIVLFTAHCLNGRAPKNVVQVVLKPNVFELAETINKCLDRKRHEETTIIDS